MRRDGRFHRQFAAFRGAGLDFALVLGLVGVLLLAGPVSAQTLNNSLWKGMTWRSIGPFRGGRVLAVTGIPGNPQVYYFGAVAGGVWKTSNGGLSWEPLFQNQPVSSVGSIAVAPSDPNVIYVGTGEACIRGNISFGDGVYKSVDSGKTWTNIGLKDSRHIGRVIIDPRNPDVVFVAALGHAYGSNSERGVFRSTDGGKNWEKVLYKDDKTGAIDITFDPQNSHILYAALWQVYRAPYGLFSGGSGSGLYKSSDGGTTWKRLEGRGLPGGILGRIGVAVSGGDSNRVYALIEAEKGGLYRSDDAGATWELVNEDHRFRQRAWYFTHIFADPKAVDTLYILNTGFFRSTDAGKNFQLLPAPHGDHHGLWIDPTNPQRMINGNDGGATITVDAGETWTTQRNQPTAQFYHVATDSRFNYYVYGAQQDNSTVAIASRTAHGLIDEKDWYAVGGGESGYIVPDPRDPDIVYAGDNAGVITRWDKRNDQEQDITVWPVDPSGYGAGELKHRFQWTAPIAISPHDPDTLYIGGEMLFKTTNGGMSWTAISPDLTRNDKSKQQPSGGPITKDNTSVEYYDTIFSVAESPVEKGLIWVGTDDGLVQLTRQGGTAWKNVTPREMPQWTRISLIDPSPSQAGTAYVAADRHELDDYAPYIYKTGDYGKTWTKITSGLPEVGSVLAVRSDPVRRGLLFAGTETGIFVSFDDGTNWQSLQLNLPTTPITDLVVKDDDLVVSTKGRSFWILDDITPLRQAAEGLAKAPAQLYRPRLAYRYRTGGPVPKRLFRWFGQNAPDGAVLNYYLESAPKDEITMEILDGGDKVVRKYSSKTSAMAGEEQPAEWPEQEKPEDLLPAEAGMNRFVWDLHYEGPTKVPGAVFDGGEIPKGPLALPGAYQVRLTVAGKSYAAPLELRMDPQVKTGQADLQKQFDLELKIRDRISQVHEAVNQIRDLRGQLEGLRKHLSGDQQAKGILTASDDLEKGINPVEDTLIQKNMKATEDSLNYPPRLNNLLSWLGQSVESADHAPTDQAYAAFDDLSGKVEVQLAAWHEIVSKQLQALNQEMHKAGIPVLLLTSVSSARTADSSR